MKYSRHAMRIMLSLLLIGCNYGAGTLGGFPEVVFPTYKKDIEKAITMLYEEFPKYKVPEKWDSKNNWSERGYDFLEGNIFYFSTSPEEMYFVTFVGGSDLNTANSASLAIRAIIGKGERWLKYDELSEETRAQVVKRFHDEIILKLEGYTKLRSMQLDN